MANAPVQLLSCSEMDCSGPCRCSVLSVGESSWRADQAIVSVHGVWKHFEQCILLPFVPLLKFFDGRLFVEFDAVNWGWFDFFMKSLFQ